MLGIRVARVAPKVAHRSINLSGYDLPPPAEIVKANVDGEVSENKKFQRTI
jgi:hypothetical protein